MAFGDNILGRHDKSRSLPVSICERGAECANDQEGQNQQHGLLAAGSQARWTITRKNSEFTSTPAQRKATYNKAFSACLEGKGYTLK